MQNQNLALGVALVAILIAVGSYFVHGATMFGSTGTRFPNGLSTSAISPGVGKLLIGSAGTNIGTVVFSACNLVGTDASQAASTTVPYDCAVTGVLSGDVVFAELASSTARGGSSSWAINAAKASTTAGFVTVLLTNNGPAATPSVTAVGSSTSIFTIR